MRQFQVPQFITVEDKVIGPFTIKQFLYVGSGTLLIVLAYIFLRPFLFWPVALGIGSLAAGLAFLKVNGRPLPVIFMNAFFYLIRPRLYVWKQGEAAGPRAPEEVIKKPEVLVKKIPKLSESKLSDLAWSLDIKSREQQRTE